MKTKQVKQQQAQERNAYWAGLTDAQKIKRLSQRPGNCTKQLNRINKGA